MVAYFPEKIVFAEEINRAFEHHMRFVFGISGVAMYVIGCDTIY